MSKTSAGVVVDFQLVTEFNAVRDQLLGLELNGHWEKPLAYWAQATDRHLPMALVDRTLKCVVETPFQQLAQTPGVGPKKLNSLIMLLGRAANSRATNGTGGVSHVNGQKTERKSDDASAISEELWCLWGSNLRSRGLETETLGRFAPSLRQIPRLMWRKRLDDYLSLSLAEIRALRRHGEKRVAALIEIVGGLHKITEHLASQPHVVVRIEPRFVAQLEDWFAAFSLAVSSRNRAAPAPGKGEGTGRELPDDLSVCRELIEPLIEQARIDVGDHAAAILGERILRPQSSMQHTAGQLGLTRSRVYELITETAAALEVRWPQGRRRLLELRSQLAEAVDDGGSQYSASLCRVEITLALLFRDRPHAEMAGTRKKP
ncbi:MAG TPA: hypothetical protein VG826_18350 [Pirellulales bacterium]|nr:hypothetical protein [Pirellulales bacterium]